MEHEGRIASVTLVVTGGIPYNLRMPNTETRAIDVMNTTGESQGIIRVVIILAGLVVILAGIRAAASIIGPLLLAVFIAILFAKIMRWLETKGVPHWVAIVVTIVSVIAVIVGFFLLIAVSFSQLVAQIPAYQANIEKTLLPLFLAAGIPVPSLSSVISSLSEYSVSAISGIIDSVTLIALVTITTLFLLVEANSFATKIMTILSDRPNISEQFSSLGEKIVGYVVIRTEVNLATGFGIGVVIAAVGLEYAVFWGFLAFALSYIPYVGFWLAVIPPMLIAWSETRAGKRGHHSHRGCDNQRACRERPVSPGSREGPRVIPHHRVRLPRALGLCPGKCRGAARRAPDARADAVPQLL